MSERVFNPMDEPEQCPACHNHPSWDEIADGVYECRNCGAHVRDDGKVVKEPEQYEEEEDLFDDEGDEDDGD